jgi:hypothetical protein
MKNTTRDNILYLTIALAVVGLLALVARYQYAHGLPIHMPISTKQFAFGFTAIGTFGFAIQLWRRAWHSVRFWSILSMVFIIYIPLHWLLSEYIAANIVAFVVISVVELLILLFVLEKLLHHQFHNAK